MRHLEEHSRWRASWALRSLSLTGLLMFRDQHGWNKEREMKVERVEIKEIMVVHGSALWLGWVACRCIRQCSPDVYIIIYV